MSTSFRRGVATTAGTTAALRMQVNGKYLDTWGSGRTRLPVKQTITARTFESLPYPPVLLLISLVVEQCPHKAWVAGPIPASATNVFQSLQCGALFFGV